QQQRYSPILKHAHAHTHADLARVVIVAATLASAIAVNVLINVKYPELGDRLPQPSWQTALGLGFVSALFDNIPLTALALKQGGYDWGYLAFAVGFGG